MAQWQYGRLNDCSVVGGVSSTSQIAEESSSQEDCATLSFRQLVRTWQELRRALGRRAPANLAEAALADYDYAGDYYGYCCYVLNSSNYCYCSLLRLTTTSSLYGGNHFQYLFHCYHYYVFVYYYY